MAKGKPEAICGATAKSTGEACGRPAGWGTEFDTGKCKHHRGTSGDGESHRNNGNAAKHNQTSDRSKLWERMSDSRKKIWKAVRQAQIERHRESHGSEPNADDIDAYEDRAWSAVLKKYSRDYMAECMEETGNPLMERVTKTVDGEKVTYERPNQLLSEITDNRREDRLGAKDRGMLNDPESKKAEGMNDLGNMVREALQD